MTAYYVDEFGTHEIPDDAVSGGLATGTASVPVPAIDCGPEHQKALEFLNDIRVSGILGRASEVISAQQQKINVAIDGLTRIGEMAEALRVRHGHTRELLDKLKDDIKEAFAEKDARIADLERQFRTMCLDAALGAQAYPDLDPEWFGKN